MILRVRFGYVQAVRLLYVFFIPNTYFRLLHARARRATVDDLMAPRATPPAVTFPLPARQWPTSPSTLLLLLLLWRADRRHKYDSDLFYERGCAHYLRMRIWSALTAPPRHAAPIDRGVNWIGPITHFCECCDNCGATWRTTLRAVLRLRSVLL